MGIAELDLDNQLLFIRAHLIVYGGAATQQIADIIAEEINNCWNEPLATVKLKGVPAKIIFETRGFYRPELEREEVALNKNALNNYFRIEEYAGGNISFVDGLYSNTGYFKLDNLLNKSTTAAHEFGHTLGLEHPYDLDLRGKGIPGIMYPRGTITDPEFQYDPNAAPGAIGGTMNPYFRKVFQADVDLLEIPQLSFQHNVEVLGGFTNIWHEVHLP